MAGRDLLVAAPERWDEACFAVPAVRALLASGLGIGVMCREEQQEFWQTLAGLEVLAFPAKAKATAAAPAIRGIWRAALVWAPGFVADAVKLAGVPRRLGPDDRKLQKRLTHPLRIAEKKPEHRVRFYLSAVEAMGSPTGNPEFFAPAGGGIEPVAGSVLLSPDSDFGPSHEWPLERWLEISNNILREDLRLTVAGVDDGRGLGQSISNELGGRAEYGHVSPLGAALPVLAGHALVIAADGSLAHLAAHVGTTCVTLFGPNDPAWKRPLGRRHAVVRRHVECAPCLRAKCPLDARCQRELETARVWTVVREKLGL